ncbi:uncharacterized protein LOC131238943 [Magnolia sinica]|uniref:uncharacterized protein LOC131238943 n=1 Tax=Magnolia sinica TaxID=86752 RepID=UPI00265AEEA4|nr:uncharacterized protein LOC131238943 [Magnolia sinica]
MNIVQKDGELLKDYIKRFNLEALQVRKYLDETALNAIMTGLRDKPFLFSLDKNPPTTLAEFLNRSQKYTNTEESRILQDVIQNKRSMTKELAKKEPDSANTSKKHKGDRSRDDHRAIKHPDSKFTAYTPLNKPQEQVLMEIKDERFIQWPNKLHASQNRNLAPTTEEQQIDNQLIGEIQTIFGGHKGGWDSNNAQKVHARSIRRPKAEMMVLARPSKEIKLEGYSVTFTDEDVRSVHHPYNNALVVTLTIANWKVFQILVDTGSSADVLSLQAFDKMGIRQNSIRSVKTPLMGFSGGKVMPDGAPSQPETTQIRPL